MKDAKFDIYIGQELKNIREKRQLSLTDAGNEINMTKQRLCNYESGIRGLSMLEFIRICNHYGTNYHNLLDKAYSNFCLTEESDELSTSESKQKDGDWWDSVIRTNNFNKEEQNEIIDFVEFLISKRKKQL